MLSGKVKLSSDKSTVQSVFVNSYLCDGGVPMNGTHHANHYNLRVYDLEKKKLVISKTYFHEKANSVLGELESIREACETAHKYATIYNDSKIALCYINNGVPEGSQNFIEIKDIVSKIQKLIFNKELSILWWDNKKETNYADCKLPFKDVKKSAWKRRYKN